MKTSFHQFRVAALLMAALIPLASKAVVFTNDTLIAPDDMTYEGQDIVVSNGVLTVDGPHAFASVRVATGATLTHTPYPEGWVLFTTNTINEPYQLIATNAVLLTSPYVIFASVVVRDTNSVVTYTKDVDYVLTNVGGLGFTLRRTESSLIADGDTVFVSYDFLAPTNASLNLTVTGDLEIESGASVNVDNRGYGGGWGAGAGSASGFPLSGGGAGHGGNGGLSSSNSAGGLAYGTPSTKSDLGSGGGAGSGGAGGAGGGAVQLSVAGHCVLNGTITANGQNATNSRAGGGSGGSVWITAQTISGTGQITVHGGAGEPVHGGGGGGGRVGLEFQTNSFTGNISATGGAGWQRGGAGSILIQSNGTPSVVTFDNGGLAGAASSLSLSEPTDVLVQGRAALAVSSSETVGSLLVRSNSSLTTVATNNAMLLLTAQGDVTLESGATLSVSGRGSSPNTGPGVGQASSLAGSGAGHGGYGGSGIAGATAVSGGNYYGSLTAPQLVGSGGRSAGLFPGGAGGGAVRLIVAGKLAVDGIISANGTAGGGSLGGGGSGGSVYLTSGQFSGSGNISANGGAGGLPGGGGGAGGRIAVICDTNSFSGILSAAGGAGAMAGGAGTVYSKLNLATYADLRADNAGLVGTNTILETSASYNLTVSGGARLRSTLSTLTLGHLTVGSNATLLVGNIQSSSTLTVASNAIVATGGSISGDGLGSTSGSGSGAGQTSSVGSTGGGHGGFGGRGLGFTNSSFPGGNIYGTTATPSIPGSGGGGQNLGGGAGGAALRMTFFGPLVLNGRISANGATANTNNAGGGSGGALWLTMNQQFSGAGSISADGGTGHLPNGGGGGGGRVALYYGSNSFTGTYSAKGGNGFNPGGAGTVYLKASASPNPSLIVDNGGLSGTNALTQLDINSLQELTIRFGGSLTSSLSSVSVSNLNIGANAALRVGTMTFNVAGTANIAAGGGIFADGASTFGQGNGSSSFAGSSGGGHGGYGGRGAGALGGTVTDSTISPSFAGGSGGNNSGNPTPGGGVIRMTVNGPMILDGKLSANGNAPTNSNGGGGAGGSVWLTLNQFSGAGSISADGGAAQASGTGGGGGGGRIALSYNSKSFTGTFSAKGGGGFAAGGAGTISLSSRQGGSPGLFVDNGGLIGTNTVLDLGSLSNLTITGGAIVKPTSSAQNITLGTLTIGTNSSLQTPSSGFGLTLMISGAANIAAGGSISADGQGNPSGTGNGFGASSTLGSGGGGHAGYGGRGAGGNGGTAYGLLSAPTSPGSGGGGVNFAGGNGGGVIRIIATGQSALTLNGKISANGSGTLTNNAGGGSGGSVWLTLNELIGTGAITADGGGGRATGGGGGGGRIAVTYSFLKGNFPTNGFVGTMSAKGGEGFVRGGAGTIYVRTNNNTTATVLVDNGGVRGTNTSVAGTGSFDLTVSGGALAANLGGPRDLFVRSNAWVVQSGNVTITRNATLDAGGGVNLDGLGTFGVGTGSSSANPKGGAGHGGYGGLNPSGSGNVYGSAVSPTLNGSSGGNGSGSVVAPLGGTGGGAVQLTVGNMLSVNGEVSADGLNGDLNSGGGSGGSVWLQAATLSGNGQITATGGSGNGTAGGGGGGRIAIYYTSNLFAGTISACGGNGAVAGGAGTIYLRNNLQLSSLLLDNCGLFGTNTPLSASIGLANQVTVGDGAVAEMQGSIPAFSNLVVAADGYVTCRRTDTNLYLALLGDLTVADGGGVVVDAKGLMRGFGPGAGATLNSQGAGGSYGGWGGDSASGAISGPDYGSAAMPVDRGSGGGFGSGPTTSGSEGGGAIHLAVAGTLRLDGLMSSRGGEGWQDDSGGGSGGSVWISARKFTGAGVLAAEGGDGDFYGGGGGGGGRIAVYSPMNTFTGLVSVAGGAGAFFGEPGTVFSSGSFAGLDVVSQSPTGLVTDAISEVILEFSEAINPLSIATNDLRIFTPYGALASADLVWSLPGPATLQINFPPQNVPGDYRLEVGPFIEGFLAPRMSQTYTGSFTAVLPLLRGTVTDTNGQPVAGVMLQPSGGLIPTVTDTNGHYSLGVPFGWYGTVTPAAGSGMFVPGARNYTDVTADATNQNYLMVSTIAAPLQAGGNGTNLFLNWNGLSGVTYQVYWCTNLSAPTWYPLDPPVAGTNGVMELQLPIGTEPEKYFRLHAQN